MVKMKGRQTSRMMKKPCAQTKKASQALQFTPVDMNMSREYVCVCMSPAKL